MNEELRVLKEGHFVPKLPAQLQHLLQPFARFETKRSSWSNMDIKSKFKDLTIDIDWTDFGCTVGEVEAIVQTQEEVERERERKRQLIEQISDENGQVGSAAPGKLETYMIARDKDHYLACVEAGSMERNVKLI